MALHVLFNSGHGSKELHLPFREQDYNEVLRVACIQADGDELEYIRQRFNYESMQLRNSRIIRWYGDDAKFIIGNLV